MKPFIVSKRTPPPPHRGRSNRQLRIPALLFAAASGALLLGACDSPTDGGTREPTTPPPYTTTVTGKVVTPAKAADPAKGSIITTARVWSSVNPANKVPVDSTDGSYTLEVANHTGSFTVTADYTAADGKYTTSTAKTVNTTGAAIDNQDIALNYGYTTTVTVRVGLFPSGLGSPADGINGTGVTVVITAEDGHEVGRGITGDASSPGVVITVDHPGRMRITASHPGYRSAFQNRGTTEPDAGVNLNLGP